MQSFKKYLIKFLVDKRITRIADVYKKKVSNYNIEATDINDSIIVGHKKNFNRIFSENINLAWLKWYISINNIHSPDYIPENIYYSIIEPILNRQDTRIAYSDKNFYNLIYPNSIFPKCILRNIDGVYCDHEYNALDTSIFIFLKVLEGFQSVIIKPSIDSGGGQDIEKFTRVDNKLINAVGEELDIEYLEKKYGENFVVQEALNQHPFYAEFNQSSINTVRVLTYRSVTTNKWNILHLIFRVGASGQIVDNSRAGGYAIGVKDDGVLNEFATLKDGTKVEKINDINLSSNYIKLLHVEKLKETAINIAQKNIHSRLLGLDMMVDKEGKIRCIEVNNSGNEINFYQLNNGPLFGEHTDEVLKYCKENKSLLYDSYTI